MVRITVVINNGIATHSTATNVPRDIKRVSDDEEEDSELVVLRRRRASPSTVATTMAQAPVEDPWFCYLMKQMGGHCKNEANVKVSKEPYKDVCGHNRGDVNDKATKPARGLWQAELICGPLYSEEEVCRFREILVITSRGLNSRRSRAFEVVEEWRAKGYTDLYCFDKRLVPHPLNPFLERIGLVYLKVDEETYQQLVNSLEGNKLVRVN